MIGSSYDMQRLSLHHDLRVKPINKLVRNYDKEFEVIFNTLYLEVEFNLSSALEVLEE